MSYGLDESISAFYTAGNTVFETKAKDPENQKSVPVGTKTKRNQICRKKSEMSFYLMATISKPADSLFSFHELLKKRL